MAMFDWCCIASLYVNAQSLFQIQRGSPFVCDTRNLLTQNVNEPLSVLTSRSERKYTVAPVVRKVKFSVLPPNLRANQRFLKCEVCDVWFSKSVADCCITQYTFTNGPWYYMKNVARFLSFEWHFFPVHSNILKKIMYQCHVSNKDLAYCSHINLKW